MMGATDGSDALEDDESIARVPMTVSSRVHRQIGEWRKAPGRDPESHAIREFLGIALDPLPKAEQAGPGAPDDRAVERSDDFVDARIERGAALSARITALLEQDRTFDDAHGFSDADPGMDDFVRMMDAAADLSTAGAFPDPLPTADSLYQIKRHVGRGQA